MMYWFLTITWKSKTGNGQPNFWSTVREASSICAIQVDLNGTGDEQRIVFAKEITKEEFDKYEGR